MNESDNDRAAPDNDAESNRETEQGQGTETWGRSAVDTACALDCPDSCSLSVSVEQGKIVAIDGSSRSDVTAGFICGKVRRFGDRVYGPDRLLKPGLREGTKGEGRFKSVSWDHALNTIVDRMRRIRDQHGAEAILPFSYGGSNGLVSQDTTDAQLFRGIAASRLARTVCAAPTTAVSQAMYGRMPCVSYADYRHARLIVIWGANPSSSSIHLVPHIKAAQEAGAALVVVDPRRTALAKQADIHLQVRPGSDVAVAMALHRFLFENGFEDEEFLAAHAHGVQRLRERADEWSFERAATVADIDADLLEDFAELYAARSPAVVRCGWGLERNRNGGNAAMAVLALPAVAGKFGVRGGGYSLSNSAAWPLDETQVIGVDEPSTRLVNMNHLGRALTELDDPPIQMLFVYNCNPVATMPNQNGVLRGLRRDDLFTVVFDQVLTDTARWADVVLPATTFLEHYDLAKSYGPVSLQLVQPAIEPCGEARPNVEVFGDLARRLGLDVSGAMDTDPEAVIHLANALPETVRDSLLGTGVAVPEIPTLPVQFLDVFPRTADGKINLFPDTLDDEAPAGLYNFRGDTADETYPLVLLSPATEKTINSSLAELNDRLATLQMHPDDAVARGLDTGDAVRLFNDLGEVLCAVTSSADVKRGTVVLPKGLWQKHTMNGSTSNALVSDQSTDIGGGACFNDARVEVARTVTAELNDARITVSTTRPVEAPQTVH